MDDFKCCCSISIVTSDADCVSLFLGWAVSDPATSTVVKENTGRAYLI